jgi:ABC-2 type transport system ATP-binding protein
MQLISAKRQATSGTVNVFGQAPWENSRVAAQMCFISENQAYPTGYSPRQALEAGSYCFNNWDKDYAADLTEQFKIPLKRSMSKLSRGQHSAVGAILGLASRAPLTIFDEPYLGLDAVARQLFYDTLLADYAEHPRTILISTHLINEIAHLLSHVLVINQGKIILDAATEDLRGASAVVTGPASQVDSFTVGLRTGRRDNIGDLVSVTILEPLDPAQQRLAAKLGLAIEPVSLQQLVVETTLGQLS